jgi:hypothetical protein
MQILHIYSPADIDIPSALIGSIRGRRKMEDVCSNKSSLECWEAHAAKGTSNIINHMKTEELLC